MDKDTNEAKIITTIINDNINNTKKLKNKIENHIFYDISNNISTIDILRSFPNKKETVLKAHQEVNDELTDFYKIADHLVLYGVSIIDKINGVYCNVKKPTESSITLRINLTGDLASEIKKQSIKLIEKLITQKIVTNNFVNLFFSSKFVVNMNTDKTLLKDLSVIREGAISKINNDIIKGVEKNTPSVVKVNKK